MTTAPTIGLALSGGGARGLAHVAACEAFDLAGVRPTRIAGVSMGALVGALYATGMKGADVGDYLVDCFRSQTQVMGRVMKAENRTRPLFKFSWRNWTPLDPAAIIETFMPSDFPHTFEELSIPLRVSAVDYYQGQEVVFDSGPLIPALAASMALPAMFHPVEYQGRLLIDGGAVNPLPVDRAGEGMDCLVASDVVLLPRGEAPKIPKPLEALVGAMQILMQSAARGKLRDYKPDVLVRPDINRFTAFDFFSATEIIGDGKAAMTPIVEFLEAL